MRNFRNYYLILHALYHLQQIFYFQKILSLNYQHFAVCYGHYIGIAHAERVADCLVAEGQAVA
jgi:hypothetical protein